MSIVPPLLQIDNWRAARHYRRRAQEWENKSEISKKDLESVKKEEYEGELGVIL